MSQFVHTLLIGAAGARLDEVESELTAAGAMVSRDDRLSAECALVVLLEPTDVPEAALVDRE